MPLLVHALWRTDPSGNTLMPTAVERLVLYLTRYAQTLGVVVVAVGGHEDHLHILWEAPPNRVISNMMQELQRTSARFVRETTKVGAFAWQDAVVYEGVSPADREELIAYVAENAAHHASGELWKDWEAAADADASTEDETPEWLREAMGKKPE